MVTGHCTHSWIGSFAARLVQLRPRIGVPAAVGCAVASFHHAAQIDPHRAVEIYLLTTPIPVRPRGRPAPRAGRVVFAPFARIRAAVAAL